MSLSLIAVFIPILLMPGIVGLLFHEFAVTLSIAILVSLLMSLTITPTMCAYLLARSNGLHPKGKLGELGRDTVRAVQERVCAFLERGARPCVARRCAADRHDRAECRICFRLVPATFFPEQDNGLLIGQIIADQSISFQAMKKKLEQLQQIVQKDPAVKSVIGFTGTRALNTANVFVGLKPLAQRRLSAAEVVQRLRPSSTKCPAHNCSCNLCRTSISAAGSRPPSINTR